MEIQNRDCIIKNKDTENMETEEFTLGLEVKIMLIFR